MILRAKFHVVLSLFSVLKIETLMPVYECPCTPLKISLPENETTVNLKSASFVLIMHLHKVLTHIQSQIKPWLLLGESFTFKFLNLNFLVQAYHSAHGMSHDMTRLDIIYTSLSSHVGYVPPPVALLTPQAT